MIIEKEDERVNSDQTFESVDSLRFLDLNDSR